VVQESNLLKKAVREVGKIDKGGYLNVSWPEVRDWMRVEGVNKQGKSCRLRYNLNALYSSSTTFIEWGVYYWCVA
jgi:hypothetical protein